MSAVGGLLSSIVAGVDPLGEDLETTDHIYFQNYDQARLIYYCLLYTSDAADE